METGLAVIGAAMRRMVTERSLMAPIGRAQEQQQEVVHQQRC